MGRIKPRTVQTKDDREKHILKAIKLYESSQNSPTKKPISMRLAAKSCGIPYPTLQNRLAGRKAKSIAHIHQQKLSDVEEKALIRWIEKLESLGFPPRIHHVREAARRLSGSDIIGKNWITRFLDRHPELYLRLTVTIDVKRSQQSNSIVIRDHFNKLNKVVTTFNITEERMYNMDEKGFIMGVADRCKVICKEMGRGGSVEVGGDASGRELLTCIEVMSAGKSGHVLPTMIIYAGAGHYMGWHKLTDARANNFRFSYSKKGWTNHVLSYAWLTEVFEPNTRPVQPKDWRLLIVDGHDSHVTIEFISFCEDHLIKLYCLPSHITHLLQPLDVGMFAPLQKFYGQAVDRLIRRGNIGLHKGNFLPLYLEAREKAYISQNIQAAWETAGIAPFNPRKVLSKLGQYRYILDATSSKSALSTDSLPLQTPKDSSSMLRMVRQHKLKAISKTGEAVTKTDLLELIDKLGNFALGVDKDRILTEKELAEFKEVNQLNVKVDKRQLGKNLARVLDGKTCIELREQREAKDAAAAAKTKRTRRTKVLPTQESLTEEPQISLPVSISSSSSSSASSVASTPCPSPPKTPELPPRRMTGRVRRPAAKLRDQTASTAK